MTGERYFLMLTPSQRMALLDIITCVMTPPLQMEVFVDVANDVETRPEDLLQLVMNAQPFRLQRPSMSPEDVPALYDVARDVCHAHGMPWTDPRTGRTYPPPE